MANSRKKFLKIWQTSTHLSQNSFLCVVALDNLCLLLPSDENLPLPTQKLLFKIQFQKSDPVLVWFGLVLFV
jgi:hypothetical protein